MMMEKKRRSARIRLLIGVCLMAAAVAVSIVSGFFLSPEIPVEYEQAALGYAEQYRVPPALVLAVMQTESGFDKDAVSSADARGLMQITPETFEWLQSKTGETLGTDALFDPDTSIRYGTLFLSILCERFADTDTVAAAYNAGMNAVTRWLADPTYSDDGRTLKKIPYEETSYYVVKIDRALERLERKYGSLSDGQGDG